MTRMTEQRKEKRKKKVEEGRGKKRKVEYDRGKKTTKLSRIERRQE